MKWGVKSLPRSVAGEINEWMGLRCSEQCLVTEGLTHPGLALFMLPLRCQGGNQLLAVVQDPKDSFMAWGPRGPLYPACGETVPNDMILRGGGWNKKFVLLPPRSRPVLCPFHQERTVLVVSEYPSEGSLSSSLLVVWAAPSFNL